MASLKPFKKSAVKDLLQHDSRKDDSHSHSNESIDVTKSYLNYDLCTKEGTAYERFKKRLSEVKCLKRDDVNVMDSLVVQLPENVKKGDERKFFEGIYAFACQDYDEKNIVTASVHRDETREHIHVDFIPVSEKFNKRKGITEERVSHEDKINRWGSKPKEYFNTLHIRLSNYMSKYMGYEVSILTGATANGNKTIQELKAGTLKNKNEELEKQIENLEKKKEENQAEVAELQEKIMQYDPPKKNLMESNKAYEERVKTYQELQAVKDLTAKQQRLQAELTAREQALNQNEIAYQKKMKVLNEELQQAYENGYSVGYDTGKSRGQAEQQKKDKAKITELENKVDQINNNWIEFENTVDEYLQEEFDRSLDDVIDYQEQKNIERY